MLADQTVQHASATKGCPRLHIGLNVRVARVWEIRSDEREALFIQFLVRCKRFAIPGGGRAQGDHPSHQGVELRQEFEDSGAAVDAVEKDRRSAIVCSWRQALRLDVMERTLDSLEQDLEVK